jgi:tetratricopeptide (TPR) repeat protein
MMSDPGEQISELKIFDEHSARDALLLFTVVRDLVLWGITPADQRSELFAPEAGRERIHQLAAARLPANVATWLDVVVSVLHAPKLSPRAGAVTEVCQRIARWAASGRMPETALAFAQAAAIAEPMDARAALLVGETAADFGKAQRADSWFQRAIGIARRVRDWESYALSYEKAGWLALARGQMPDAENKFRRALHAARRHGIVGAGTNALVGLLQLALETDRIEDAKLWHERAARAVRRTRVGEARLMAVAVDLWMRTGDYARALESLDRVRLDATTPAERVLGLARTAHAAAGAGDRDRLIETWPTAWALTKDKALPRMVRLRSAIELHRAAGIEGDTVRAADALRLAMDLAISPGEVEAVLGVVG